MTAWPHNGMDPLAFDVPVPHGGYVWWYFDAISDDGQHAMTAIAFIGSVFSPYYAMARRKTGCGADPLNHCALNIALYSKKQGLARGYWAMTERGRERVERSTTRLGIGASAMQWDGQRMQLAVHEMTAPWARRLRGDVSLFPSTTNSAAYVLDAEHRHLWCPIAPRARVEVSFSQPDVCWSGTGYLDSNRGTQPLELDFQRWDWSRAGLSGGRSAVLYDITHQCGTTRTMALAFDVTGVPRAFDPPPRVALPDSAWRMKRFTRSDKAAQQMQALEDGPFYTRSLVRTHLLGESTHAMHESLDLQRWSRPVVQLMLPFRMPRWTVKA
jgi:carotenoid 1,2-hydratase